MCTHDDILDMTPEALSESLKTMGEKAFRAKQVLEWVYQRLERDFNAMTNLSAALRTKLAERFCVGGGGVIETSRSDDGRTVKFLFELADGARVEAVSMVEDDRHTACISCQVGCAMECRFCATARMGFRRNLTPGEMLFQCLEISRRVSPVNRVVFMGMGEPFLNTENVLAAVDGLMDERRFGLGGRRITISTCGVAPAIREMGARNVPVRLALSLNSPFQEQRERLMPVAKTWPLEEVLDACAEYIDLTNRRVLLEYALLRDENTSPEAAKAVADIARRIDAKVNLIEYNPTPSSRFGSPTREETQRFRERLEQAGVTVMVRYRRGREINAGCGQLAAEQETKEAAAENA